MTDARDIIHQIEYRWHDTRDLSPAASTMSQESLRGWDALIRAWVRHPHVDGLSESVCYQVLPNSRAALAWRYEDLKAAEHQGRPLVSRVLVGPASLLTPEAAITLCRTGLPDAAGPRPGPAPTEAELSVIEADELGALVREQTAGLDEEAAGQEGLRQVVAAALSNPYTPLAIHVRDKHILKPPEEGLQCALLWGLRRIVWPLFGTAGRGWSFSTFEPPLGDVDPATLPDILFRQTQDAPPTPPARPRKEIKVRPFDPSKLDDGSPHAQLAGLLVAEYSKRGGDDLGRVIAEWCGAEQSPMPRLSKVYGRLRPAQSRLVTSAPPAPYVPPGWSPEREPDPAPRQHVPAAAEQQASASDEARDESAPAPDQWIPDQQTQAGTEEVLADAGHDPARPAEHDPTWRGPLEDQHHDQQPADISSRASARDQDAATGYSSRSWSRRWDDSLAPFPREGNASPLPQTGQGPSSTGSKPRPRSPAPHGATVSDLLKVLPAAGGDEEFESILQAVFVAGVKADPNDLVRARREVSQAGWFDKVCEQADRVANVNRLSSIFWVIVVPDLGNQDVIKKISEWTDNARPEVIGGLLLAAKNSGDRSWQLMMQILQPRLAHLWTIDQGMESLWDPALAPRPVSGDSGRGFLGFRKKS